ncbi:MAG: deoxyribonuclease, partial [Candidatus Nanohaloarchaea archaeon]
MDVSDSLLALFSARVEERNGSYVVKIPEQEIELGQVEEGGVYRVGLLEALEPVQDSNDSTQTSTSSSTRGEQRQERAPPVEEGDIKEVEIEDMG